MIRFKSREKQVSIGHKQQQRHDNDENHIHCERNETNT